jgi:hypothetical protein
MALDLGDANAFGPDRRENSVERWGGGYVPAVNGQRFHGPSRRPNSLQGKILTVRGLW